MSLSITTAAQLPGAETSDGGRAMAPPVRHHPKTASLRAALLALLLAGLLLVAMMLLGLHLEKRYIHAITPEMGGSENEETGKYQFNQKLERAKNQGMAFQRLAFCEPDLLPLYGSSELLKPVADKANIFFRNYPTGFTVFPVGKPGATCLILLQKIGSVAEAARDKRVVISLSASWFFNKLGRALYEGNFSSQQATLMAFSPEISHELKREIARRMLASPRTLEKSTLLKFILERLAGQHQKDEGHDWMGAGFTGLMNRIASADQLDRLAYAMTLPLGRVQSLIYTAQDHLEVTFYILKTRRHWEAVEPQHIPKELHWDELIADATKRTPEKLKYPFSLPEKPGDVAFDDFFRRSLTQSHEWEDLELLIRLLKELGMKPLILSMPLNGPALAGPRGVSGASLMMYTQRLREIAGRYGVPVNAFEDHVGDPSFLNDQHDHMSERGWMFYNRALDAFFHGRDMNAVISGATADAAVVAGKLTTISVFDGGSGYATPPRVIITAPIGSGAAATAALSGGRVVNITVTAAGSGYPATGTTVTMDPPSSGPPMGAGR